MLKSLPQFLGAACGLCVSFAFAGSTSAAPIETIVVTTVEDVVDFDGEIDDLPGPDGKVSFREALAVVNNLPGAQSIAFAIPISEWWVPPSQPFGATVFPWLKMVDGAFLLTDDGTVVDFSTQAQLTGKSPLGGNEVGIYSMSSPLPICAIQIDGDGCLIRGLDAVSYPLTAIWIRGSGNRVVGCITAAARCVLIQGLNEGQPASHNVIGGTASGESNVFKGVTAAVKIAAPAESNVIIGNQLSTPEEWATASFAILLEGTESDPIRFTRIGGPNPAERNVINDAGAPCGDLATPCGALVRLDFAADTVIEGNYLGVNSTATAAVSQWAPYGIDLDEALDTTIRGNVIGGISLSYVSPECFCLQTVGRAIYISGTTTNTVIQGNHIGIDPTGTIQLPNARGIQVEGIVGGGLGSTTIGGLEPGDGNHIANTANYGIRVGGTVSSVMISGNSMHDNGLAIDLIALSSTSGGVTPNDPLDLDAGGNGLQNFPIVESAIHEGDSTSIQGALHSSPDDNFRIELFRSAACDPSGYGEGEHFLGWTNVETDGEGNASFTMVVADRASRGDVVTSTATRLASGDTSEFSPCREIVLELSPADLNGDGVVNGFDLALLLGAWGRCSPSSQCAADLDASGIVNGIDLALLLGEWG